MTHSTKAQEEVRGCGRVAWMDGWTDGGMNGVLDGGGSNQLPINRSEFIDKLLFYCSNIFPQNL